MTIYDKIAALCKTNGTSICAVEKNCGLGNGTIQYWKKTPRTIQSLITIADYFGVPIEKLIR